MLNMCLRRCPEFTKFFCASHYANICSKILFIEGKGKRENVSWGGIGHSNPNPIPKCTVMVCMHTQPHRIGEPAIFNNSSVHDQNCGLLFKTCAVAILFNNNKEKQH